MKKTNRKGFTIVELVIVIAVIAILAAVLIPVFSNVIKKANVSSDTQLIRNLNEAVAIDKAEKGIDKHDTMYDAVEACKKQGYMVDRIVAMKSSYNIAWEKSSGNFILLDMGTGKVIYPTSVTDSKEYSVTLGADYYVVTKADKFADIKAKGYSSYAYGDGWTTVETTKGFDVGDVTTITAINYTNSIEQNVILRTNSANTILTINDTTNKEINHYGTLGKLFVTKCGYNCYYEYGITAYSKAEEGKLVAKAGGVITVLYATEAAVSAKEDGGVIGEAYCVSTKTEEAKTTGYNNFSNSKGGNVEFVYTEDGTPDGTPLTKNDIEQTGTDVVNMAIAVERLVDFKEKNYWIGCAADEFAGGDGTENNPYQIATAEQLSRLAFLATTSAYKDYNTKYYKLTADIDLSGKCWVPIFTDTRDLVSDRLFEGTFDGNNHKIIGLNATGLTMDYIETMINSTTPEGAKGEYVYGLFGDVGNATIKDVDIQDVYIEVDRGDYLRDGKRYLADSVGSVVGFVKEGCTLNISNVNILSGQLGGFEATGGIIGRAYGSVIMSKCSNAANIEAVRRAGGLIGYNNVYYMNCVEDSENKIFSISSFGKTLSLSECSNSGAISCMGVNADYSTSTVNVDRHVAGAACAIASDSTNVLTIPEYAFKNTGVITTYYADEEKTTTTYIFASHVG